MDLTTLDTNAVLPDLWQTHVVKWLEGEREPAAEVQDVFRMALDRALRAPSPLGSVASDIVAANSIHSSEALDTTVSLYLQMLRQVESPRNGWVPEQLRALCSLLVDPRDGRHQLLARERLIKAIIRTIDDDPSGAMEYLDTLCEPAGNDARTWTGETRDHARRVVRNHFMCSLETAVKFLPLVKSPVLQNRLIKARAVGGGTPQALLDIQREALLRELVPADGRPISEDVEAKLTSVLADLVEAERTREKGMLVAALNSIGWNYAVEVGEAPRALNIIAHVEHFHESLPLVEDASERIRAFLRTGRITSTVTLNVRSVSGGSQSTTLTI